MTGWRACGMLAFHLYRWNKVKVIRLASRLRMRKNVLTFLDIGGSSVSSVKLPVLGPKALDDLDVTAVLPSGAANVM